MDREQQILDAAEKLFAERSFDGVGVDAIGREAGITGSAIYRHFASKDEILGVLFDRAADALLMRIGEPAADPREELALLVRAHVEFAVTHERLAGIWTREQRALAGEHQRRFRRRQRVYTDRWLGALDQCYPGHSTTELVATVRAAHALITSDAARSRGGQSPPELRALLQRLTLAALGGLAATADAAALTMVNDRSRLADRSAVSVIPDRGATGDQLGGAAEVRRAGAGACP